MIRHLLSLAVALAALATPIAAAEPLDLLVEEKARDSYGLEMPEGAYFKISLHESRPEGAAMLSAFWMDRGTGRFLANAVTEGGDVRRITGLAVLTVSVPVPVRRMLPGEIVARADVTLAELPQARIGSFAHSDAEAVVGMQVRRVLAQGRPIMAQSIMEPLIIDRGDRVSIRYDDGLLAVSAPGRALDDAHRGQELRIVNLVSNTSLIATATAEGIVEVIR